MSALAAHKGVNTYVSEMIRSAVFALHACCGVIYPMFDILLSLNMAAESQKPLSSYHLIIELVPSLSYTYFQRTENYWSLVKVGFRFLRIIKAFVFSPSCFPLMLIDSVLLISEAKLQLLFMMYHSDFPLSL
jgi:hypothetical protein